MTLNVNINGVDHALDIEPGEILLDVLRRAGFHGVKRGCETATCGSCVVLVDNVPQFSCAMYAASVEGRRVTTIEALGTPNDPHPIMQAFVEEAGVQCGYCVPGMLLSTKALLDEHPQPTEGEIRTALDAHLCRCTGYVKQVKAVQLAAERMAAKNGEGA